MRLFSHHLFTLIKTKFRDLLSVYISCFFIATKKKINCNCLGRKWEKSFILFFCETFLRRHLDRLHRVPVQDNNIIKENFWMELKTWRDQSLHNLKFPPPWSYFSHFIDVFMFIAIYKAFIRMKRKLQKNLAN
jgi:hypothetical protein